MNNFIEKWKSDKRYQTKIKLLAYTIFVVIVAIYALSLNNSSSNIPNLSDEKTEKTNEEVIKIPAKYSYTTTIDIDGEKYTYSGTKTENETTIIKTVKDKTINYIYKDNEYFQLDNGLYIKITKDEVYDVINYNYINLDNINTYLIKAKKDNNQYLVYLKDVVLGNDSDKYFVILVNKYHINIDYTPLMKEFNNNIKNYTVDIKLEEMK